MIGCFFNLNFFKEILAKVGNPLQFGLVNIIEGVLLFLSLKDYQNRQKLVKIMRNFNEQDKEQTQNTILLAKPLEKPAFQVIQK